MTTKGLVLFASLTASWVASLLAMSDFTSLMCDVFNVLYAITKESMERGLLGSHVGPYVPLWSPRVPSVVRVR
jgi:hypothetical protein